MHRLAEGFRITALHFTGLAMCIPDWAGGGRCVFFLFRRFVLLGVGTFASYTCSSTVQTFARYAICIAAASNPALIVCSLTFGGECALLNESLLRLSE